MPTAVYVCIHCSANPDKTSIDQYTHQANANSCVHLFPILCQPRHNTSQPLTLLIALQSCVHKCVHSSANQDKRSTNQYTHRATGTRQCISRAVYICVSLSDNQDKRLTNTRPGLKTLYIYNLYMSAATSLLTKTSKTKQKSTNQSPHQDKALSCLPQHQLLCQQRQDQIKERRKSSVDCLHLCQPV